MLEGGDGQIHLRQVSGPVRKAQPSFLFKNKMGLVFRLKTGVFLKYQG